MINSGKFFLTRLKMIGVFILFTAGLLAQTDKIAFEKYGVAEGLPEEFVTSMIQDDQGFIWAATQNGLVKFDGYKIKTFQGNLDDPDAIWSRNLGGGLLKASDGKIWIGSGSNSGGLAFFDPRTEKFTNFLPALNDSLNTPYANCDVLFEDLEMNIWFRSYSENVEENVLCRYDPRTKRIHRYPYELGAPFNDIVLNFNIAESQEDGSIWIVSQDKTLMRYAKDLDKFEEVLSKGEIIPGTTKRDSIQDITRAGKSGLIPMGNNKNIYLWDPMEGKVVNSFNFPNHKDSLWIGSAFEDQKENFWVSSDQHLTRINIEKSEREDYIFGEEPLMYDDGPKNIASIIPVLHDDSFVWFMIRANDTPEISILRYDHQKKSFEWFDNKFNEQSNELDIWFRPKMLKDRTGILWLGNRPSLYKQNPKANQIELYKHDPEDPKSVPSDQITNLFEDSKERLWVGTESGLSLKLIDNTFRQFFIKRDKKPLTGVFKIYEDSKGQIWVISDFKLFQISQDQQSFEPVDLWKNNENVVNLLEDSNGNIWVSSWTQGVYIIDGNATKIIQKFEPDDMDVHGLLSSNLLAIFIDSRRNIWLGDRRDNEFGLFKYDENGNKFKHYHFDDADSVSLGDNEISFMAEDDMSRVWVGTDGGLSLYDHEKDIFYRNNDDLNLPSVHAYSKGIDGKMWFWAYSGGGLGLVGPDVNTVQMFGENKGLLHNDMAVGENLTKDNRGKLWLPNQRGLSIFDTNTQTFKNYFEKDGFQKYSRMYAVEITTNGDVWIGGSYGLNRIDPNKLSEKDSIVPAILITSMGIMDSIYRGPDGYIFKEAVSYTNQINLKYWQKDISFEFVALHYLRPEDNLYSWKLENYDSKWSTPSKERQVSYTNLSPGKYVFHVKGSNADGIWNEEGARMEIIIAPPWWMTWWAYVIYAFIVGLIGIQIHKYQRIRTLRVAREKAQKKELEQAKEIEKAYTDLKATQSQLIQSEKMASLGELTAGIAHEIQNPLNFVNNFSEVNSELIEEMKEELEKGNLDEVQVIAKDIDDNEKKIMFHGKRADSIVKGMLQHSRTSNGKKEPSDINALADEYLRLAYHGLRAKDKSFNATMKTNFDEGIGNINIISQDIGRVVLNLITNAFYVVDEKKKASTENYEPTVTVSTKKEGQNVEIKVIDNANGIPEKILKKIFQPFFTTKPSGKGTGLGLSLSYDIVTAHGGELKVNSKKDEGTEFTIILPNS